MALIRAIFVALLAVFIPLALAFVVLIVSNVPAGLRLAAMMATAKRCTPPEHVPANAGKLLVADLRLSGDGSRFSTTPYDAWLSETLARIRSETNSTRDLVVYVHGFRSDLASATCTGDVLRAELAALPAYVHGTGPDIFVFAWPGEFSPWQFTAAQSNATHAGPYLGDVLKGLAGRRIILVAHSLGSNVAMVAMTRLPATDGVPPVAGMLLIQGAIPAVSIRTWHSTYTLTHPSAELYDLRAGKQSNPPYVETAEGAGQFVAAAAKAAHLVVTTAGADIPLGNAFSINETFAPSDRNRPMIMPERGDSAGNGIDAQAIGTPFPSGRVTRFYDEVLPDPLNNSKFDPQVGPQIPDMRPTDPSRVLNHNVWEFEFRVPHRSYHEIRLDRGQWYRVLYDWHSVMIDQAIRERILRESWAVFNQQ